MKIKRRDILRTGIGIALLLMLAAGIAVLNRPIQGEAATAASKLMFAKAQVTEIISDDAYEDTWTEGMRLGVQEITVRIETAQHKGESLYAVNYLSAYGNVDLKEGARVIVRLDYDDSGKAYVAAVYNYYRGGVLAGLTLLFVAVLVLFGGRKGAASVLGLVFTVICIWFLLIPLLKRGVPPIPAAILLVAITTAGSLVLLNGFSMKTLCATLGCVGGVTIAGVTAQIVGMLTPIHGFHMSEAEELVLRATDSGLQISGLLVSGILISALGAVMDVAMGITSSVFELYELNPQMSSKRLFQSGLNIGRDTMGTMSNTLILAFAGASLNTLILFRTFDYPLIQIFNSDIMAIEIIQSITGSIGIVLTVPLVAAISSALCVRQKQKA